MNMMNVEYCEPMVTQVTLCITVTDSQLINSTTVAETTFIHRHGKEEESVIIPMHSEYSNLMTLQKLR